MTDNIEDRACALAVYMIETGATVRSAARHFGISKSTVHKDLSQRLPQFNKTLYEQVRQVLELNKQQRHIRGGMATRRKYRGDPSSVKVQCTLHLFSRVTEGNSPLQPSNLMVYCR